VVHIWLWSFPLPPFLSFLPAPFDWALATLLIWLAIAVAIRFVAFRIIRFLVRRTESDVEDVILDVSRRPLVAVVIVLGVIDSLRALSPEGDLAWAVQAERWLMVMVIATVTYWAWRLLKEVVIHYGERLAQRSETRLDDVLLPIVNQFAPIALFIIGGSTILQYLGVHLDALLVAMGGAAFILAFALQDILSNVFSGLSLLVDTPFRYGDLVKLEDGTVCQVIKIGVRVTQLFDIDTHAVIYMPNSKLANERLINLMQPTPELISSVRLVVSRESDIERVRQLLIQTLDGHPDLLGVIPAKLQQIGTFEVLSEAKRAHGVARLQAEQAVDQCIEECHRGLRALADQISRMEQNGISKSEQSAIKEAFAPLALRLGEVRGVHKRLDAHRGSLETFVSACLGDIDPDALTARTMRWVEILTRDPDIVAGEDDDRLRQVWSAKIVSLWRRIDETRRRIERLDGLEQRLDDAVLRLAAWTVRDFKQLMPAWKGSGASFKGFDQGGLMFSMFYFVDNIELEHFWRQVRVEGELRREVARRLRVEGIEFASPHLEITFRQGMAIAPTMETLALESRSS
jgi:MscS family membrane protein